MSRKRGKKRNKKIKTIIGIDETNAGFHLSPANPHTLSSVIVTGYLTQGITHANYGSCKYEHKGKLLKRGGDFPRALERGRDYIRRHPDFLYTTIDKKPKRRYETAIMKGNASALLVFEFFLRYNLKPAETCIVLDEADGERNSEPINYILSLWLKQAGLQIPCRYKFDRKIPEYVQLPYPYIYDSSKKPYRSKTKADDRVVAVRKADVVGYYIGAIHYLGDRKKWPYRERRVPLHLLEEKCLEVSEKLNRKKSVPLIAQSLFINNATIELLDL
jgi:hypothetical protein